MNRLARRDQPVPPPARRQPGRLVPVGRRGARPGARRGPADPALDRLRGLPLVPRDGARVVRGRGDRGADERALRHDQGRPRGAARPRLDLHGRGRRADGAGRLADDRLPDARTASRSTAAPTTRPSRGTGCRASARCCSPVAEAYRERRDDVGRDGSAARRAHPLSATAPRLRASRSTDAILDDAVRDAAAARSTRRWGGWGGAPKFPPASVIEFLLRRGETRDGGEDARRDGRGRDVRRARRRLPPLLGRRALARAALREDALRQRAARPGVPARLARARQRRLPPRRRGDRRLPAPRAAARGRRLRLGAGRRHRRRRGADLHVDARRSSAASRRGSSRSSTAARSSGRGSPTTCARGCSACASGASSRSATTRRSPPGTGSRSPRSPRRGGGSSAPTWSRPRASSAEFLLGPLSDGERPSAPDLAERRRARAPATSRTTRASRTASTSCTSRPASCAGSSESLRLARLAVELFADERARRLLPHAGRRRAARRAQEGAGRQPDAERQLDARVRPAAAGADLRRRRARAAGGLGASGSRATAVARARARSAGCSARSTCTSRRGASSRSSARRTASSRAPRWRRSPRTRSSPSGRPRACRCSRARRSSTGRPAVYVCESFACRAPVTDVSDLERSA